jgi:hypothetical protein
MFNSTSKGVLSQYTTRCIFESIFEGVLGEISDYNLIPGV